MTVCEIARRARVSLATVSRIINRVPSVDPVLARRVWRVIEEVGYYPNTHARALASGRSRIFGLLVSDIINPFFPEIVQTFAGLGSQHNYEILLSSIPQDLLQLEMTARRMIERRVDGVAILSFEREDSLVDIFRNQNVPVFTIDADSAGELLKTLRIDYRHGIRQAVQHLAALGHVRIAFISGPPFLKTAINRKLAFEECMKEIALEVDPQFFIEGDHTMQAGMDAVRTLAGFPNRPSAVVCSDDMTAIGIIRGATELSLDVPRNLSVVGFEDIRLAQFMIPPLTTVRISQIEMGNLAFSALLDSAEHQCDQPSRQVYEITPNLVIRRSTSLAPDRLDYILAKERSGGKLWRQSESGFP